MREQNKQQNHFLMEINNNVLTYFLELMNLCLKNKHIIKILSIITIHGKLKFQISIINLNLIHQSKHSHR